MNCDVLDRSTQKGRTQIGRGHEANLTRTLDIVKYAG